MRLETKTHFLLGIYGLVWTAVAPGLYAFPRLREGWRERLLKEGSIGPVDIWMQASSGGEAYLALEIISRLDPSRAPKVLVTTGTAQGLGILKKGLAKMAPSLRDAVETGSFPFDRPALMRRALGIWKPRLVVLLETEIWPGLLAAARKESVPVLILNGRLSRKSLRSYRLLKRFWREVRPERVFAVSRADGDRFGLLFGPGRVELMNNIKFDRMRFDPAGSGRTNPLRWLVPEEAPFLVLGSVRKQEEDEVLQTLKSLVPLLPDMVTGVFPRHMHRIKSWKKGLAGSGLKWVLRSEAAGTVAPGTVVLWDTFGELSAAYGLARAVFVGGTLRPCGGQNFLEAVERGVVPCIGPYWEHFLWVVEEILQQGLVEQVGDWRELVKALARNLRAPLPREVVMKRGRDYVRERKGGTDAACREIMGYLQREAVFSE
jgi:3-deoxy-D-manno-octulosonic-acid transferase